MEITAAILPAHNKSLRVEPVKIEEPRSGEILVKIVGCGICHAETLAARGDLPFPTPGVLGHEGAGIVAATGPGVRTISTGDHVVLAHPHCGTCRRCLAGETNYCHHVLDLISRGSRADGSTALRTPGGTPLHSHFFGQSSFATYALASANQAVRVPAELPLEALGQLGCGVITGAGAVFNTLCPPVGSSIVIFGVGAVGLSAVMAARCTPATKIIAVDRHLSRLRLAQELGATDVVDSTKEDVLEMIREICKGPADFSLECSGNMSVLRQAVDCLGMLGVCGLIGGAPSHAEFTLDHFSTMIGKRIVGIHGGEGQPWQLIGGVIDLHLRGRFPFDRLTTSFELEDINEAITASRAGEVVKATVRMPT